MYLRMPAQCKASVKYVKRQKSPPRKGEGKPRGDITMSRRIP